MLTISDGVFFYFHYDLFHILPFILDLITCMFNFYCVIITGASPGFGRKGPRNFFFRFWNLHVAKRHAAHGEAMRIARGVRGHAPPRKFFKTVQFGAF